MATKSTKAITTTATVPASETELAKKPDVTAGVPFICDELADKIKAYGGNDTVVEALKGLGVTSVSDLIMLEDSELVSAGLKLVPARNLLKDLKKTDAAEPAAPAPAPAAMMAPPVNLSEILPTIPNDDSFLSALKTGGIMKVDTSTLIGGIRVMFAYLWGMYDIPQILVNAMTEYAEKAEEPVPPTYYVLMDNITHRDYSDLFAAIPGLTGKYASPTRRQKFVNSLLSTFPAAFKNSFVALNNYYQSLIAASNNPATIYSAIATAFAGQGATSPVAAANLPSAEPLRDVCETLKNAVNHAFRGTGCPVSAAMAYDAMEIKKVLEDSSLPAMVGAANREMMLKQLDIGISPDRVRMEQTVVRYIVSFVQLDQVDATQEVAYLTAMWQLGNQINWDELFAPPKSTKVKGGGVASLTGENML